MNNCLCESCCDKDYCLSYQDYRNSDGIVAEPITACGRYKKLHIVEDTYTKEEVIDMFNDLKSEIEKIAEDEKNYDVKWALGLLLAKKIIQEKIDKLEGNKQL